MERTRLSATGTVVELDWDEDGNVLALGLETSHETYEIEGSVSSGELADLVGCKIRATGWLTDDSDEDLPLLKVSDFEVLNTAEEEEDECAEDDLDD